MIVNLGWSDGGHGELRAADSDRDEVRRLLDVARDEGRLDAAEHDRRVGTLPAAKTRGDLARVTTDLPERKGVREWVDGMRVRGADREDAGRWLAEAAAQGRLGDQEYEQRLAALSTVATYAELTVLLDGLPGWSGTPKPDVLAGAADRDAAVAVLAEAVADGRVKSVEAPALEADIRHSRRVREIDALLAPLAERVSDQERQDTVEALAAAHRDGQLDVAEYAVRTGQAQEAASDTEMVALVADLRGDARRLTEADRRDVADTLRRAVDDGRLDLAEFDERVTAAEAATTMADVTSLVADLAAPPRPVRRDWTDALFDRFVVNSALIAAPRFWILKLVWKAAMVTTLLVCVYLALGSEIKLVVLVWSLLALLWLETVVMRGFAGPVRTRRKAVVDELRARVDQFREAHPAIKETNFEYPAREIKDEEEKEVVWEVQVRVVFEWTETDEALVRRVGDEIVRLLWLSRLYPLKYIIVWMYSQTEDWNRKQMKEENRFVWLDSPEGERLRHRYGPRPYGPYQEEK